MSSFDVASLKQELIESGEYYGGGAPETEPEKELVGDALRSAGAGLVGIAQGAVGLGALVPGTDYTPDTAQLPGQAFHALGGVRQGLLDDRSPAMQQAQGRVDEALAQPGFANKGRGFVQAAAENPYYLYGLGMDAVGSLAGVGKLSSIVGRALPKAMSTAGRAGVVEGGIVSGLVAGQVAEKEGTSYTDRLVALPAGVGAAALGYGAGKAAGRMDPEVLMGDFFRNRAGRKLAKRAGGEFAKHTSKAAAVSSSRIVNAGVNAGIQAVEEGAQEALEQGAVNVGTGERIMNGVGESFIVGAAAGALIGGPLGATQKGQKRKQLTEPRTEPIPSPTPEAEPDQPAAKNRRPGANAFVDAAVAITMGMEQAAGRNTPRSEVESIVSQVMDQAVNTGEGLTSSSVQEFLNAMNPDPMATVAQLEIIMNGQDAKAAKAARTILSTATGLPKQQVPNFERGLTPYVTKRIEDGAKAIEALDARIKRAGDLTVEQRTALEAERKQLVERQDALVAIEYTVNDRRKAMDELADKFAAEADPAPVEPAPPDPKELGSDGQNSSADPSPQAKLTSDPVVPEMDGGRFEQVVSRIIAPWRNSPAITIVENMDSPLVPQAVRDAIRTPDPATRFMLDAGPEVSTPAFEKWFRDSKVRDDLGVPAVVYHGSRTDIKAFDTSKSDGRGWLGGGLYFTGSTRDASENYAGTGPDLRSKMDDIITALEDDPDFDGGVTEATRMAEKILGLDNRGVMYPVYLSLQNPAVIEARGGTFIESGYRLETEPFMEEAVAAAKEAYGEGNFEYTDVLDIARDKAIENGYEYFEGGMQDILDAINAVSFEFDGVDASELEAALNTMLFDGATAYEVDQALREAMARSPSMYPTDVDGSYAGGEVIRRIFEEAGFDGIIDREAGNRFRNMSGISPGDTHYVAFNGNQVKSALGNSGEFDPENPDIRFQQARGAPAAFYYRGQVYLNKAGLGSEQDVARALYHEVIGHHGIKSVLGARINPELDRIWGARGTDVLMVAKRYGLDVTDVAQRREAVEEFIAEQAEALYSQGFLDNILSMLRAWWQDLTGQTLTDDQILRDLIKPAENFVARRATGAMERNGGVRFQIADQLAGGRIMAQDADIQNVTKVGGFAARMARAAVDNLGFTFSLLRRMERRIPATRKLISALQDAQRIGTEWQKIHNSVNETLHALKPAQRNALTDALVFYSSNEEAVWPAFLEKAMQFTFDESSDNPAEWSWTEAQFSEDDVTIDGSIMNTLDDQSQEALKMVFETTAHVLAARTRMKLAAYQHFFNQLIATSSDPDVVMEEYGKAMRAVIATHNQTARSAYASQSRVGEFQVTVVSPELAELYEQAEGDGDPEVYAQIKEMELDSTGKHFVRTTVETETEARALVEKYVAQGMDPTRTDYRQMTVTVQEGSLNADQLITLLAEYEAAASDTQESGQKVDRRTAEMLQEGLRSKMRAILVAEGSQDPGLTSQMEKRNIAGVQRGQVLDNTMRHVKHFGFAIASAQTSPARIGAISEMQQEMGALSGQDNAVEVGRFNQVIGRLNEQFDDNDGLLATASRGSMAINSFWLLLSNPSYYALQLTQTGILTGPYMAGEFGADAWTEIAKAYPVIGPEVKASILERRDINFDAFGEGVGQMFQTLLERNVLDVGMDHDFGRLGTNNPFQRFSSYLYRYARQVETINRMSASLAAYNLRMAKLTKGRKLRSFTKAQQAEFQRQATNYAEQITYKTHGDYSFINAPEAFRTPVLRNIMQFKKIGVVVAELMAETAREGWRKPVLSKTAQRFLAQANTGIDASLIEKMAAKKVRPNGANWLTDAEIRQVHETLLQYRQDTATKELTPKQLDMLDQLIEGELNPRSYVTREQAIIARKAFTYMLATSGLISGSLSVPFLTSMLALMAYAVDDDDDGDDMDLWDDVVSGKWAPKDAIMRGFGPELGSWTLRGVAGGLVGIDVSRRVGINFVEQMLGSLYDVKSREPVGAANEILTGMLGPSASMVQDLFKGANYLKQYQTTGSDHDLLKGLAAVSPLGLRNFFNAKLLNDEGLVNDSRTPLIPREEFSTSQLAKKAFGLSPSMVSEFYDMRTQFDTVQRMVDNKRLLIKRSYLEAVNEGDTKRRDRTIKQWREMQREQRAVDMQPSPLAELQQYVARKRKEERRQIAGLQTSRRNRTVAERVAQRYGFNLYAEE